jgi:uncharacterized membrane protein YgcG
MAAISVLKIIALLVLALALMYFGLRYLMAARTKGHKSGASDQSDGTTLMLMTAAGSTSKSPSGGHHDGGGHHGSDGGGFDGGGFDGGAGGH